MSPQKSPRTILLFSSLLLVLLLTTVSPCMAEEVTITFSTVDFDTNQNILIYDSTNEFVSENTTTDTITLNASRSYLFIFRPTSQTWFENPLNTINLMIVHLPTFLSYLLWVAVILCILILTLAFSGGKRR